MTKHRILITLLLTVAVVQLALAGDKIVVCGQNLQNFFYSLDRGRTTDNGVPMSNYNTVAGRNKKLNAIVSSLSSVKADIYAFNEVEARPEALELLAERMSEETGIDYKAVEDGINYDLDKEGNEGGFIKSGYIYNAATVKPYGDNFSTGIGYTFMYNFTMRLQTFESLASGERFSLSMNHFKSGSVEENGATRVANCASLLNGLAYVLDPDILVVGDLNSQMGEKCLDMLVDAGYEEQLLRFDPTAYSYVWRGTPELIDHVFANKTMAAQVTNARMLYIANPSSIGYYNAYSDHDPYVLTLDLKAQETPSFAFEQASTVTAGDYLIVAKGNGDKRKVCTPVIVTESRNYATPEALDIVEENGVIKMFNGTCIMTFEDAGNGLFYIRDSYGRYASHDLKSGTQYYTTITATDDKKKAHCFCATRQSNGSYELKSTTSDYWLLYFSENDSYNPNKFTLYWAMFNGRYPFLYKRDTSSTDIDIAVDVHRSSTVRKVLENGRLIIVMPDGHRYSMDGRLLR